MPTYVETMNYVTCCIICAMCVGLLGAKIGQSVVAMQEVQIFRILAMFSVVVTLTDAIWKVCSYHPMEPLNIYIYIIWFLNMLYFVGTTSVCYLWYDFISESLIRRGARKDYALRKWFGRIPFIIGLALHLLSPWFRFTYWINSQGGYERGSLFVLHTFICVGYLVSALVFTIESIGNINADKRKETLTLVTWTSIPVIGAVFQIVLAYAPFNEIAMTIAMLYLFVSLQESRITTDALTGITNRAQMDSVLNRKLRASSDTPFILFISDLNGFKRINDIYGHLEGDKALIALADTFRKLGNVYASLFVCRYGGDEFLLTLNKNEGVCAEAFIKELEKELKKTCQERNFEYELRISVGYSIVDNSAYNIHQLIANADKMMYENKAASV